MYSGAEIPRDRVRRFPGYREATQGSRHATYPAYEFAHLTEGRFTITPDGSDPVAVVAGDAFVVEKDFKGTWKIEEKVRKHFDFRPDRCPCREMQKGRAGGAPFSVTG